MGEITSYLQLNPCEDTKLFLYLISQMDDEYLSLRQPKPKKSKPEVERQSDTMTGNKF